MIVYSMHTSVAAVNNGFSALGPKGRARNQGMRTSKSCTPNASKSALQEAKGAGVTGPMDATKRSEPEAAPYTSNAGKGELQVAWKGARQLQQEAAAVDDSTEGAGVTGLMVARKRSGPEAAPYMSNASKRAMQATKGEEVLQCGKAAAADDPTKGEDKSHEDAFCPYQMMLDREAQIDALARDHGVTVEAVLRAEQRARQAGKFTEADLLEAVVRIAEDEEKAAMAFNRKKCLQHAFATLKSKAEPEATEAADAQMCQSEVEAREAMSEAESTPQLADQGHIELECTEADLEAAVGMMAAAVTQARDETKERETMAEGTAEDLCTKMAEGMAENLCIGMTEGTAEDLCIKMAEGMAGDLCIDTAKDTEEDLCVKEEQNAQRVEAMQLDAMEAMQLDAMEAVHATKAAVAQMKTEHAAMLQALKKAIEAEVERQGDDLYTRVQELQQKRHAMQERHDAELMVDARVCERVDARVCEMVDARVCEMVAKMVSKDARPAEEEQSDDKTEEIEQKMTLDTEIMGDDWSNVSTDYENNAKTPLIVAADIETKKIESMKSKTIPRKLKKGDAKMIEHPKKKRKRLSMKSKTGGVCKAKHASRAVGAHRTESGQRPTAKVAINSHPPHPHMNATLSVMQDGRQDVHIRGAVIPCAAKADVECTNHVREDVNCAREKGRFKEAETEAKAEQAEAREFKADAETPELMRGEKGNVSDEASAITGSPARRDAEKLTRTQADIDCFVDAFQAVLPDVTVNEAIACLESHGWSVQNALRSMMRYDVEVETKIVGAKERDDDAEIEMIETKMKMAEAKECDADVEVEMKMIESKARDDDARKEKIASVANVKPVDARRDEDVKVIEMKTTFITDTRERKEIESMKTEAEREGKALHPATVMPAKLVKTNGAKARTRVKIVCDSKPRVKIKVAHEVTEVVDVHLYDDREQTVSVLDLGQTLVQNAYLQADSIGKVNIDDDEFGRQSTVGRMSTIQASGEYERSSGIVEEYRDRIVLNNYDYKMKPQGAGEFRKLKSRLSVTGTGTLSQFLGMDYMRDREVITREVSMEQYVARTVSRFEPQGEKFAQAG